MAATVNCSKGMGTSELCTLLLAEPQRYVEAMRLLGSDGEHCYHATHFLYLDKRFRVVDEDFTGQKQCWSLAEFFSRYQQARWRVLYSAPA